MRTRYAMIALLAMLFTTGQGQYNRPARRQIIRYLPLRHPINTIKKIPPPVPSTPDPTLTAFADEKARWQRDLINDIDPNDETIQQAVKDGITRSLQNDENMKKKWLHRLMRRLSIPQLSKDQIDPNTIKRVFTHANDSKKMIDDALQKLL